MDQVLGVVLEAATYGSTDRIIAVLTLVGVGILLLIAIFGAVWRRP